MGEHRLDPDRADHEQADGIARELRTLDARIQEANWLTELTQ